MDVIEAIYKRRSVRSYEPKPVERDLIESLILDASQAPPPFRGQSPWVFNVVEGVQRIAAYGARAMEHARKHHPDEPGWDWLERPDFKIFWDAPALIIISGPVGDCCRAGQNLMLSAHARGLGTCWVGSPMLWLNTSEAKAELGIPANLAPIAVLCLGYPAAAPDAVVRERPSIIWAPDIAAPTGRSNEETDLIYCTNAMCRQRSQMSAVWGGPENRGHHTTDATDPGRVKTRTVTVW